MDSLSNPTQNKTAAAILRSMDQMRQTECMNIINSAQFLDDPFISVIFAKAINLGFNIDIIKEIFCEFLIDLKFTQVHLADANFDELINADLFIESLVKKSSEYEQNQMTHLNSSKDTDENSEDLIDSLSMNGQGDLSIHSTKTTKIILTKKMLTEQQRLQNEQNSRNEKIKKLNDPSNLRPVIIDCKDIALSDSSDRNTFLVSRIRKVIEYFEERKHKIYAILSQSRRDQIMGVGPMNSQLPMTPDQQILFDMEQKNQLHCTPSKRVAANRRIDQDEDIVKLQFAKDKKIDGIIVSNNNFRKYLYQEDFKKVIEDRVLVYTFIDETFIPNETPNGKGGPNLDNFLRFEQMDAQSQKGKCPYKKKCTFGAKCKYWHPEREQERQFKSAINLVEENAIENMKQYNDMTSRVRLEITKNKPDMYNSVMRTKQISIMQPHTESKDQSLGHLGSMSLSDQIQQQKICEPTLRAMGPGADTNSVYEPSGSKKLSNLLAKKPQVSTSSNLFCANDFLGRYGSGNNNNSNTTGISGLDDYSQQRPSIMRDLVNLRKNIVRQLYEELDNRQLSEELADEVMAKYPNETDDDQLIFLARGLRMGEDDF